MGMTNFWTEERVATLKAGWAAGLFAADIADEIGGRCTKNMVIGKANRLNLKQRDPAEYASRANPIYAQARRNA